MAFPCALVGDARHRKAVLLLVFAHSGGGLCTENAVRHERCSAALRLLDAPQKGLQIENMAAFLCIGVQSRCLLSNGIAGVLSRSILAAGQHVFGKIGHALPCQRADGARGGQAEQRLDAGD